LAACVAFLKEKNSSATIVTAPWSELDGKTILAAMEKKDSLDAEMERLREQFEAEDHEHHHHHHHDDDDDDDDDDEEEHEHHHHHHDDDDDDDDDDDEHEHHHHHHDHDDEDEHEHHHHHHDHDHDHDHDHEDGECSCGHDHHHHHHDHDADEVFSTWGNESSRAYTEEELGGILTALDSGEYGTVLRAKGIVPCADGGKWLHFDYVPEEHEIRRGAPDYTGRLCVIGAELNETALAALFGKE
jgi:hypothetical protein